MADLSNCMYAWFRVQSHLVSSYTFAVLIRDGRKCAPMQLVYAHNIVGDAHTITFRTIVSTRSALCMSASCTTLWQLKCSWMLQRKSVLVSCSRRVQCTLKCTRNVLEASVMRTQVCSTIQCHQSTQFMSQISGRRCPHLVPCSP